MLLNTGFENRIHPDVKPGPADGCGDGPVSESKAGVSKSDCFRAKSATVHWFRLWFGVLAVLAVSAPPVWADEPAAAPADAPPTPQINVRSGATGRFVFSRWGAVTATVANPAEQTAKSLVVVTPSSGGLQYGRRLELPGRTSFDATWPVLVSGQKPQGLVDFRYLSFPGGVDDGIIRTRKDESELPSFSVLASEGPMGLAGYIPDNRDGAPVNDNLLGFTQAARYNKLTVAGLTSFLARDVSHHSECLEPLDALTIGDPRLANHPMACDAIRLWLQRGGRMFLPLDVVGEEVVRVLLGDSFPMTLVGETSATKVELVLNPDYSKAQYPVRTVTRTFPEPVRWLRIQPGAGEVIWTVDGWPVALRIPVGRGFVILTTIESAVFIESRGEAPNGAPPYTTIASCRRMLDTLFDFRPQPLIRQETAAAHAASQVGYQIPGRLTALLLLSIFPIALGLVGVAVLRRSAGEKLIWVVPALAAVSAVPALLAGISIRSVAPNTVLETRVMMAGTGARDVVSDGYTSVYVPSSLDLPISSDTGTILDAQAEAANQDYRRLVWEGAARSHWEHLNQPSGLKTYGLRAVRWSDQQYRIVGTFDEQGFVASLQAPGFEAAEDFLVAGLTPDRMRLAVVDGMLRATPQDLLDPGQFWSTTLTTEEQRQRTGLMESVFDNKDRTEPFPAEQMVLCWEGSDQTLTDFQSENLRRSQNTLMMQPIRWKPPAAGAPITSLSPFMSMRSIETQSGGFGGVYNNPRRQWVAMESASDTLIEYLLPEVCRPFRLDSAEMVLSIRAGSRKVRLLSGTPDNLQLITELDSPLGRLTIPIPAELAKQACLQGRFYLQIEVSEVTGSGASDQDMGEQDDNYAVSQCLIVLKGSRQETSAETAP